MNRDLLRMLDSSESYEDGLGLIQVCAESIDEEAAAAILEKSHRPGNEDRAPWLKGWYTAARGAAFLNTYLHLLGVDSKGAGDFFDKLQPEVARSAVDLLLPRIEDHYKVVAQTVSEANALAENLGIDYAQDQKREFEEKNALAAGYTSIAGALAEKSQDDSRTAEVLLWKGIWGLLERDFAGIFGESKRKREMFREAKSSLEEALALTRDFAVKIRCMGNLGNLWFEENLERSFEYLNQAQTELDEKINRGPAKEESQLKSLYFQNTGNLSRVLQALNRFEDCYRLLSRAIEVVEKELRSIAVPNLIAEFCDQHQGLYSDMVTVCMELGRKDREYKKRALQYAEMINARVFLEGWRIGGGFGSGADPLLLKQREELLGKFDYLKTDPSDQEVEELKRIQHRIGLVEQEIWEQSKIKVFFNDARPAVFEEIVRLVPPDGVLIEYFMSSDKIYIFVVDDNDLLEAAEVSFKSSELRQIIDMANLAIGCRLDYTAYNELEKDGIHLPWVDLKNLGFMYKLLIEPVSPYLEDKEPLYLVPHADLRRVPFQALYRESREGKKWLIEEKAICYGPSASILRILKSDKRPLKTCFAAGVSENNGGPDKGLEEAEMAAGLFRTKPRPATKKAFLSEAGEYDVIHISCHSSPKSAVSIFNGLKLEDGVLLPGEIGEVKCSLATLSACETYGDDISMNRELAGITGGFLRAGAGSVVASLWPVHAGATYILMENFYKNLIRGENKARALQKAQMAVKMEFSDHPLFWAPFMLVGTCD